MKVRIEGSLSEDAVAEAIQAQTQGLRLIGLALLGLGAFSLIDAIPLQARAPIGNALLRGIGFVVLGGALWFLPVVAARRLSNKLFSLGVPVEGEASSEGLRLRVGQVSIDSDWAGFHQAKILESSVVLYDRSLKPHVVPRHFISGEAEWQLFREWVRTGVKRSHRTGTVSPMLLRRIVVALIAFLVAFAFYRLVAGA